MIKIVLAEKTLLETEKIIFDWPRNVSCNWCIKISEYYLENIWKLMFSK